MLKDLILQLYSNDPSVRKVNLFDTGVSDLNVHSLVDALKANTVVSELNLGCNAISGESMGSLCELLTLNTTLSALDLSGNQLDTESALQLRDKLLTNRTLLEIDISGNLLVSRQVREQVNAMVRLNSQPHALKQAIIDMQFSKPTVLDLSLPPPQFRDVGERDPTRHIDDWCTTILAEHLSTNRTVLQLRLCNQRVSDSGAIALANMLSVNTVLDDLDLFGNAISRVGVMSFVEALKENNSLRKINVYNNIASDDTLRELSNAILLNNQPMYLKKYLPLMHANDEAVTELTLDEHESQRFYDDVSTKYICDALRENTRLTRLILTNNTITAVGCGFLAEMLRVNTSLVHLDLSGNPLGSGCAVLASALRTNRRLEVLVLRDVSPAEGTIESFCDAIYGPEEPRNNTLIELDLGGNPNLNDAVVSKLVRAYRKDLNRTLHQIHVDATSVSEHLLGELRSIHDMREQPKCLRDAMNNPTEHIQFRNCNLHDDNISVLCSLLKSSSIVASVDVSHNKLTSHGLSKLCDAMLENSFCVSTFNFSHNPMGEGVSDVLLRFIRNHGTVSCIDARYTGMDTGVLSEVAFYVSQPQNTRLQEFLTQEKYSSSRHADAITLYTLCHRVPSTEFKTRVKNLFERFISISLLSEEDIQRQLSRILHEFATYVPSEKLERSYCRFDNAPAVLAFLAGLYPNLFRVFTGFDFHGNYLTDDGLEGLINIFPEGSQLERLDIADNELTDNGVKMLMAMIQKYPKLTRMRLDGNAFSQEGIDEIETALSYNRLPSFATKIVCDIRCGRSNELDLCNDTINENLTSADLKLVFDAVKQNENVRYMNISHNHIDSAGFVELCKMLSDHPSIEVLVAMNLLIRGEEVADALCSWIRTTKTLRTLDLSFNDFNDKAMQKVHSALLVNRSVRKFELKDCNISDAVLNDISCALQLNKSEFLRESCELAEREGLEVIALPELKLGDTAFRHLFTLVAEHNCPITKICLRNNSLTDASVPLLVPVLNLKTLRDVDVSKNQFSTDLCRALRDILLSSDHLHTVDLSDNGIDNPGARDLAEGLRNNRVLHLCRVDGNLITEEAYPTVCEELYLNQVPDVRDVIPKISRNDKDVSELVVAFGASVHDVDYIVQRVAVPLETNIVIESVSITVPEISLQTVLVLMGSLEVNRCVKRLDLHCGLRDEGAAAIASMLRVNKVIEVIDLANNNLTSTCADLLRSCFDFNYTLHTLVLEGNVGIDDATRVRVQDCVDVNDQFDGFKSAVERASSNDEATTALDFANQRFSDVACSILCRALWDNTSVTALDISHSVLSADGWHTLFGLLEHNPTITSLNVSGNIALPDVSGDLVDLLMHGNHSLKHLIAVDCNLSDWTLERVKLLCDVNGAHLHTKRVVVRLLEKDPSLKEITLDGVGLSNDQLAVICRLLATDLSCHRLSLTDNHFDCDGMVSLANMLRTNTEGLQYVALSGNAIGDVGVAHIVSASPRSIVHIELERINMTSTGVVYLQKWLRDSPTLTRVNTTGNVSLTANDDRSLEFHTAANKQHKMMRDILFTVFDGNVSSVDASGLVSYAAWDGDSARLLASAMRCSPTPIQQIEVNFNDMDSRQFVHLVEFIESDFGSTVTHLVLRNNHIQDISRFMEAVRRHDVLKVLDLSHNRLGVPAAKDLAVHLRNTAALGSLQVEHERWGDSGVRILLDALRNNGSVTEFCVGGSDVSTELMDVVNDELAIREKTGIDSTKKAGK
eukprot:PhM_4_TR10572/c0_g1_i1/m.26421